MGKFEKGHKKIEGAGMQKGQKTVKVQQWEALGELIQNELTGEVMTYVKSLPKPEMFDAYLKLLEYFKPKLSRSEIKADVEGLTNKIKSVYDVVQQESDLPESEPEQG